MMMFMRCCIFSIIFTLQHTSSIVVNNVSREKTNRSYAEQSRSVLPSSSLYGRYTCSIMDVRSQMKYAA